MFDAIKSYAVLVAPVIRLSKNELRNIFLMVTTFGIYLVNSEGKLQGSPLSASVDDQIKVSQSDRF